MRLAIRIVSDEYLDLYVLAVAALTFTILGIAGVAGIKVLASVTLALLAVLAYWQIRSRRHVADTASRASVPIRCRSSARSSRTISSPGAAPRPACCSSACR